MKQPLLFLLLSFCLSPSAFAITVEDYVFIKSEITKAQKINFADMKAVFSKNPVFSYDCVYDQTIQPINPSKSYEAFNPYLSYEQIGDIKFIFKPGKYGFDIIAEKNEDHEIKDFYKVTKSVECGGGDAADNCGVLTFDDEKQFTFGNEDDWYGDQAVKTEAWSIYFVGKDAYAERRVDFTVDELGGALGAKVGTITYTKAQVCALTLKGYEEEL